MSTLTGTLKNPDNSAYASGVFYIRRTSLPRQTVVKDDIEVTTDASGNFSVTLAAGDYELIFDRASISFSIGTAASYTFDKVVNN